jgi:hypothetical protein
MEEYYTMKSGKVIVRNDVQVRDFPGEPAGEMMEEVRDASMADAEAGSVEIPVSDRPAAKVSPRA